MAGWERAHAFVAPFAALSDGERADVERARERENQRRIGIIAPGMLFLHLASAAYFAWRAPAVTAAQLAWRSNLVGIHLAWAPIAAVFALLARGGPRLLGGSFLVAYVVYGAVTGINSQLIGKSIDVFLAVLLALAALVRVRTLAWTLATFGALVLLVAGTEVVQPDAVARTSVLANAVPVALATWFVSRIILGAFVRDELQARTISRLNEALDAQLREKLVDRSRELARALEDAPAPDRELSAGAVLRDRFVIGARLGRGGMGVVYRARDRLLGRWVAVKLIALAPSKASLRRFLQEVEVTADLTHAAIARALHVDVTEDGRIFQVQELVDGETLEAITRKESPLGAAHVARIGATVADALATAHARGIVHRDVKPSNVMLIASAPGLKLLDFGVSRMLATERATKDGGVVGTPAYMAPEQRDGEAREPADVYALGATLRTLLLRVDDAPPTLSALVDRALAPDPTLRPTADVLRDELVRLAGDADLVTLNLPFIERAATAATA